MVNLRGGPGERNSPSLSLTPEPLHLFSDLSNIFVDQKIQVAVAPIAKQGSDYVVLVTTPAQAQDGEKIGRNLQRFQGRPDFQERLTKVLSLLERGQSSAAVTASGP
jgi:hypothetical protein